MTKAVRLFLLLQGGAFLTAALIHFGVLMGGYEHLKAGIAESVIATVLLIGLLLTSIRPQSTRTIGLAAQGFALFGTAVGIFTIVIGVGPRTIPDVAYHIGIVGTLLAGLITTNKTVGIGANAHGRQ